MNLVISYTVMTLAFIILILTIDFLITPTLSIVPIILLFILAFSIISVIVNKMKYNIICKAIEQEYPIDRQFLCLYLLKFLHEEYNTNKKISLPIEENDQQGQETNRSNNKGFFTFEKDTMYTEGKKMFGNLKIEMNDLADEVVSELKLTRKQSKVE